MPGNPDRTVREGRSLRVLVAEDNEVHQALAARLLANRGHHAVIVSTGREALDAWERDGFDLILMDVQMPQTHAAVHDASRSDVFDVTAALEAVDGERELLHGIIGIFVRQTPRVMSDIDAALAAGDASALAMAAHKLKGSVAMFGARAAREAAQRLEDLAEAADLAGAADARARLGEEVTRLHAALEALAAGDAR